MRERMPYLVVILTVAINALGIGLVIPVMPGLLLEMGVPNLAEAASIGGMLSLVFAAMQFLCAPLLGRLSDRYGRRAVLMISLLAISIDYAILALAGSLWLFFLARMISGMASATFSVANAVLADISPPETRAASFGLTGAAFGIGFVLGPVVGGLLAELGPRAPFVAAAALAFLNASLAVLTLPETLKPENRRPFELRAANPFAIFRDLARRPALGHLVSVSFLDTLSGLVYPAVWAYFALAQFGWTTATVGLSLASYGFFFALTQAGLIRVILRYLGEQRTAVLGLGAGVLGFVILTQLNSGLWAFLLTPLFALRAVSGTALNGLLSRRVGADEQGTLQGILTGMTGLATLIGIPLMTQIFAFATRDTAAAFNGAPFAAAACLAALALVTLVMPRLRQVHFADVERSKS
jgi:DHA1 family tetracycline resistance protein-like MFS transporter